MCGLININKCTDVYVPTYTYIHTNHSYTVVGVYIYVYIYNSLYTYEAGYTYIHHECIHTYASITTNLFIRCDQTKATQQHTEPGKLFIGRMLHKPMPQYQPPFLPEKTQTLNTNEGFSLRNPAAKTRYAPVRP